MKMLKKFTCSMLYKARAVITTFGGESVNIETLCISATRSKILKQNIRLRTCCTYNSFGWKIVIKNFIFNLTYSYNLLWVFIALQRCILMFCSLSMQFNAFFSC